MSIFNIWMGVLILGCVAVVGNMDYADAVTEQKHYCLNVSEGIWPDYKESFKRDCGDGYVEKN